MALTIKVLGHHELYCDERRLLKLSKKAIAVLVYLAIHGPTSRAAVADLLWPSQTDEASRHSLRNCLYEMAKILGRDAYDNEVSWDFFDISLKNARTDIEDLETSGRFLEDLLIPSEPWNNWVEQVREAVEDRTKKVYSALLSTADAATVVRISRTLAAQHPYDEPLHRELMEALTRRGHRPEALLLYHRLARALRDELRIAPETETIDLYHEIRRSHGSTGDGALLPPIVQLMRGLSAYLSEYSKMRDLVKGAPDIIAVAAADADDELRPRLIKLANELRAAGDGSGPLKLSMIKDAVAICPLVDPALVMERSRERNELVPA